MVHLRGLTLEQVAITITVNNLLLHAEARNLTGIY